MIGYVISDIHVDFYVPQSKIYLEQEPHFEKFYQEHFLPADVLFIAGDIANDYYTQVGFLRFIAGKYAQVYVVHGNHDLLVKNNTTFGNGNPFKKSADRMQKVADDLSGYPNVHILEGPVEGPVGGCMGFADFMYGYAPGAAMYYWKKNFIDARGWNYMRNRADAISLHYKHLVGECIAMAPKVMMTHYCPIEMGVSEQYADDPFTPCFYFTASEYMNTGSPDLWICGHTHDQYDTTWVDANGRPHRILCNPLGYPSDLNDFAACLASKKYLIEVDL